MATEPELFDWKAIQESILADSQVIGDHIVVTNKSRTTKSFNGYRLPLYQWSYYCEKQLNPEKGLIDLRNICDQEDCVKAQHWVDMNEDDAIFKMAQYRLNSQSKKEGGCLLFTGFIDSGGYGRISFNNTSSKVHIVSMLVKLKVMSLPENTIVRHKCTNKHCFAIEHLETGTSADNAQDRVRDGNGPLGEQNPSVKLTTEEALEIYQSKGTGTLCQRAKKFGVTPTCIQSIDQGKTWSHVTGETKIKVPRKKPTVLDENTPASFFLPYNKLITNNVKKVFDPLTNDYHWIWTGAKDREGYGIAFMGGRNRRAHAASWMIHNKKGFANNLMMRHKCSQKDCVFPGHLEPGTAKENAADRKRDGTQTMPNKIDEETAKKIFERIKDSPTDISNDLGVSYAIVQNIRNGNSWKELRQRIKEQKQLPKDESGRIKVDIKLKVPEVNQE